MSLPQKRTKTLLCGTLIFLALLLAGCGHHPQPVPPAPSVEPTPSPTATPTPAASARQPVISPDAKPIYTETGLATWYAPYKGHPTANGEAYDGKQLTAAHKTLPLNSVARVTDLATGKSTIVRITDRGPFVGDRILDLSPTAAKAIGLWTAGIAKVKIEVLYAPAPIDHGGRWAVQIGAFSSASAATKLKQQLERKYHTADVLQFQGSTGQWLRIRVLNDEKSRAEEVANTTKTSEGQVFLVRLD